MSQAPLAIIVAALLLANLAVWASGQLCAEGQLPALRAGDLPPETSFQASLASGFPEALAGEGLALQAALESGSAVGANCHDLHWGLVGNASLACIDGQLSANLAGCVRARCQWHRYAASPAIAAYEAELGAEVASGDGPPQWPAAVLAPNGAAYAPPLAASGVLRINGSTGEAAELEVSGLPSGFSKYNSAVLAADGAIYGVPYSATQVLRIDPATDEISLFGDFSGNFKWSHGVLAGDGKIYCMPASATAALRIDPFGLSATLIAANSLGGELEKWVHAVIAPTGHIFGIPADASAVLRIDPVTQSVETFGDLGADPSKWAHGLVGIDGKIYGVPASATAVLRVDPSQDPPLVDTALGSGILPTGTRKWQHGVAASDGSIYCVPRAAEHVLRINPLAGAAELIGSSLGAGNWKWQHGTLAPDGAIYAVPADATDVLRIDTNTGDVELLGAALGSGERKYSTATLMPSGTIFAVPSFAARLLKLSHPSADLCLGAPLAVESVCTLGQACSLVLEPAEGRASALGPTNIVWVVQPGGGCHRAGAPAAYDGLVNPQTASAATASGGRLIELGAPFLGQPTHNLTLCWAPGLRYAWPFAGEDADVLTVGTLSILGPDQGMAAACSLGVSCEVTLTGAGLASAAAGDAWLALLPASGPPCGDPAAVGASLPGFTNPRPREPVVGGGGGSGGGGGDGPAGHVFGAALGGEVGDFLLCWSQGNSSSTPPMLSAFVVHVGSLQLRGPSLLPGGFVDLLCWAGFPCGLGVQGVGLAAENRMSIRTGPCSEGSLATIGGLSAMVPPSESNSSHYAFGAPSEGSWENLSLCWHADELATGVDYGSLQVYGPLEGGADVQCTLNLPCEVLLDETNFAGSPGRGLSMANRLQLVPGASSSCPGSAAVLWDEAPSDISPVMNGTVYPLGTPLADDLAGALAITGSYRLCWSPSGAEGTFLLSLGSLTVHDSPCAVPAVEDGLSPACRSTTTGLPVPTLRHGEACAPLCADDFSPSQVELRCGYGALNPATFLCQADCLYAPTVENGLSHQSCLGHSHGEVCPLNCPAGTLKSGDLVCEDGHWDHISNPAITEAYLLFGVPRCYRSCGQPSSCASGTPSLGHGDRCQPNCPAGAIAADVAELYCRDGEMEPPTFTCTFSCADPPDIPHSVDLRACAGTLHGGRCGLRCEDGYTPGSDPVCQDGTWTASACHAFCAAPEAESAAEPPCQGGLDELGRMRHGVFCLPQCLPGFTPMQLAANSGVELDVPEEGLLCEDGVFSGTVVCRADCQQVPDVEYAELASLVACRGAPHNSTCPTPCLLGYQKSGDLQCHDGEWNDADVTCIKECLEPPVVEHGVVPYSCRRAQSGDVCEIACDPGFVVTGTGASTCEDGAWSPVTCLAECQAPSDVLFAAEPACAEGLAVANGTLCTPACLEGFAPSLPSLACSNGVLQPTAFTCARPCGSVEGLSNTGDLSGCTSVQAGETCELACANGFVPTGSLFCNIHGQWQAHRSWELVGVEAGEFFLEPGRSVGSVTTSPSFEFSFEIVLNTPAGGEYQSVFHFTETGNHCCGQGDRVPAIYMTNPTFDSGGSQLCVFMDPGQEGLCTMGGAIRVDTRTLVTVKLGNGTLHLGVANSPAVSRPQPSAGSGGQVAEVFAGSPWHEAAHATIRNAVYRHVGLEGTMPECRPVTCESAIPAVPGAEAQAETSGCAGAAFGDACADVACPIGSELQGRFVCSGLGTWEFEDGLEVRCLPRTCPEAPPAVPDADPEASCPDRGYADLCPVACLQGFAHLGGYLCGADGGWTPTSNPPPSCLPEPCGPTPSIPNGLVFDACGGLPSGASCQGFCRPDWSPLGSFRCEAGIWVEAPICLADPVAAAGPPAGADGEFQLVVAGGAVARPSTGVVFAYASPSDFASALVPAFAAALRERLPVGFRVQVVAVVGSLGPERSRRDGGAPRRLQAASARPRSWRVDLAFLVLPLASELEDVDARDAVTALASMEGGDVGEAAKERLLATDSLAVTLSAPRLINLPVEVVDFLGTEAFSEGWKATATSTAAPPSTTTTTTTQAPPGVDNRSDDSLQGADVADNEESEGGADTSSLDELLQMLISGEPLAFVLLGSVPLSLCCCLIVMKVWLNNRLRSPHKATKTDEGDFEFSVESRNLEFQMDGLDPKELQRFYVQCDIEHRQSELIKELGLSTDASTRPRSLVGAAPRQAQLEAHTKSRANCRKAIAERPRRRRCCATVTACCCHFLLDLPCWSGRRRPKEKEWKRAENAPSRHAVRLGSEDDLQAEMSKAKAVEDQEEPGAEPPTEVEPAASRNLIKINSFGSETSTPTPREAPGLGSSSSPPAWSPRRKASSPVDALDEDDVPGAEGASCVVVPISSAELPAHAESVEEAKARKREEKQIKEFFDFPQRDEMLKEWHPGMTYYEREALVIHETSTMQTSTREDVGGNIIEPFFSSEFTREAKLEVCTLSVSKPCRKVLRDREEALSSQRSAAAEAAAEAGEAQEEGTRVTWGQEPPPLPVGLPDPGATEREPEEDPSLRSRSKARGGPEAQQPQQQLQQRPPQQPQQQPEQPQQEAKETILVQGDSSSSEEHSSQEDLHNEAFPEVQPKLVAHDARGRRTGAHLLAMELGRNLDKSDDELSESRRRRRESRADEEMAGEVERPDEELVKQAVSRARGTDMYKQKEEKVKEREMQAVKARAALLENQRLKHEKEEELAEMLAEEMREKNGFFLGASLFHCGTGRSGTERGPCGY